MANYNGAPQFVLSTVTVPYWYTASNKTNTLHAESHLRQSATRTNPVIKSRLLVRM
jgi:hypothetical protein